MGSELDPREMAAAPLSTVATPFVEKAPKADKLKADKGERKNLLSAVFGQIAFKLPNKAEAFKNDDGTTTKRLAHALIQLAACPSFTLRASVYERTTSNADGSQDVETYLAMPSSGKGFPKPVFECDDAATQQAYDEWRLQGAQAYEAWAAKLRKSDVPVVQGSARLVKRLPAPVAPAK